MSEMVNTHPIDDPERLVPMNRKKFYEEQVEVFKETGHPSKSVDVVNIFIFNSKGELLVQKRSYSKSHNPGLLDKSMGGHVQYGDTRDFTVMVETVQELQTPSIVLKSKADFDKTYDILNGYLETLAIIQYADAEVFHMKKIIENEEVIIANKVFLYFGIYNGRVRPSDGEAQGVLWYSLEDLDNEMEHQPQLFTGDIHTYMKTYRKEIEAFIEKVKKEEV